MINRPEIPPRRRPRRPGFTLIELLVAVAILVIMLMAFGRILAQSQALVTGCQQIMRMNTLASVTAQLLQRDLLSVAKDGSLTVGPGKLTFTRVAATTSVQDPTITANGALIDYGRAPYGDSGILYRQALLLLGPTPPSTTAKDIMPSWLGPALTAPAPVLPPDINAPMGVGSSMQYWSYLAAGCTKFNSYCWDGPTWSSTGTFTSANLNSTTLPPLPPWPTAVRIFLSLKDGTETEDYELLFDLP